MLLGGGHAHLPVLRAVADWPAGTARVTLVSPHAALTYSGLLPEVVAGRYPPADAEIALPPLAQRAGVRWIQAATTAIDAPRRRLTLVDAEGTREEIGYDFLSVDVGGVVDRDAIEGAREHAVFVRPVEHFMALFEARLRDGPGDAAVVGGGAGGYELALALRRRLGPDRPVHLVTGPTPLLGSHAAGVRRHAARVLAAHRVALVEESCRSIAADHLVLASGATLRSALTLVVIGSVAPPWLAGSGLELDAAGFIVTRATLQSTSHPEVFAAGDVATRCDAPRPRSGVYAVRAGPPLARNLHRALQGLAGHAYAPQRWALSLLGSADGRAIASWGPLSFEGRLMGRLKNHIDRRFVARSRSA